MNQFPRLQKLCTLYRKALGFSYLFLFLAASPVSYGLSVQIIEDRVWIDVNEEPLMSVLQAFADRGVKVRTGPGIDATVSGSLSNTDLEDALADLLGPYNYVLNWKQMSTLDGSLVVLDEIQVFRPGQRSQATNANPERAIREIIRHPDGYAFVNNEILVGLKPGSDINDLKQLLMHIGGSVVKSINPPGIYLIRLGDNANAVALIKSLQNHPSVAHAELNLAYESVAPISGNPEDYVKGSASVPNVDPSASAVAILDSGLLSLPELEGRIGASLDATNPDQLISDDSGHGTQMALIASGLVTPTGAGILPEVAPVIPIRTFQADGYASSTDLINALQFAAAEGASVVNMSWGSPLASEFLESTLRTAGASGLTLVAAAGNDPTGDRMYPAAYDDVIAVSATDSNHDLWASSNYGDFISVAAPGFASLPVGHKGPAGSYAGTSIASAYVASALSTYLAKNPTVSREQGVENFLNSLTDAGAPGRDSQYGYGVLDEAAMRRLSLVGN